MNFVRSAALTHPGRRRPNNEDFVTYFEPVSEEELEKSGRIYILADGVGGASKGERASQYAAQKILYDYYRYPDIDPAKRLKMIIQQAGNDIFEFAESQESYMQMATTVVVAVERNGTLQVAHVGDSRAYLIKGDRVTQLTQDHSTVGEMMRDGILSEEEAMNFEGRNPLSRSLGGQPDVKVDVTEPIPFSPGDKVLLVSDGFSRYATRETIRSLLEHGPPGEVVYRLIDYANQEGGADNISAILVEGVEEEEMVAVPAGGQVPEPVDWETIPTQPSVYSYKKPAITSKRKKWIWIGAAGVLIVLLIILFGPGIFKWKDDDNHIQGNPESNITQTFQENTPHEAILPMNGNSESELTPTTSLTSTPQITETTTLEPSVTFTNTLEDEWANEMGFCEYTVKEKHLKITESKALSAILEYFLGWKNGDNYSYAEYIQGIEVEIGDFDKNKGQDFVKPGWKFTLPEISRKDCLRMQGKFIPFE